MQERQCVILQGDRAWCQLSSQKLLEVFDGKGIIALTDHEFELRSDSLFLPQKKAQQQLGKEFNAVIFDALDNFSPDSLAAIMGTIKAGGVLILFLSKIAPASLWLQRFNHILAEYSFLRRVQKGDKLPLIAAPLEKISTDEVEATQDQKRAINSILNVVHGHRRRPLVLSSDRGRGKSAALGFSAAALLREGRQCILVTAPSSAAVTSVFKHATHALPNDVESSPGLILWRGAEIRFIAPDVLVGSKHKADIVLVDEAAAIPVLMLDKLLKLYSRLVFSTTLHGYEGTGRGFALRFYAILNEQTPHWHHCEMSMPIRWAENDELEAFGFDALLLNATPLPDEVVQSTKVNNCTFELIDKTQLAHNEIDLRALFGLMVLAHYRTRPSDLQMMLDREDMSVYVMRHQGHIVASAWLVDEGTLDNHLSHEVYAGNRRLNGHLLPQSLLAHAGITTAGSLKYQRIIRIVVHPAIQSRGLGAKLLNHTYQQAKSLRCDVIGVSFSSHESLIHFWSRSHFSVARLGLHKDKVSGGHSIMMLRSSSEVGEELIHTATLNFEQQWFNWLHHHFEALSPKLVITISQLLIPTSSAISHSDRQEIEAFAVQQRGFDFSQFTLKKWLVNIIRYDEFKQLSDLQQYLCVMAILQQRSWHDISQTLTLQGKAECIKLLREAISQLLLLFKA